MSGYSYLNTEVVILKKHFRKHFQGLMRAVFNRSRYAGSARWTRAFETAWLSGVDRPEAYIGGELVVADFVLNFLRSRGIDVFGVNEDTPAHNRAVRAEYEDEARFLDVLHTPQIRERMGEAALVRLFRRLGSAFHAHRLFMNSLVFAGAQLSVPDEPDPDELFFFNLNCVNLYYRSYCMFHVIKLFQELEKLMAEEFLALLAQPHQRALSDLLLFGYRRIADNPFYKYVENERVCEPSPLQFYFAGAHLAALNDWEKVTKDNPMGGLDAALTDLLGGSRDGDGAMDDRDGLTGGIGRRLEGLGELELRCTEMAWMVSEFLAMLEREIRD